MNEVYGTPSSSAVWTTTSLGDVFVFDPCNLKEMQYTKEVSLYVQEIDVLATDTPYETAINNG